MNCNPPASYVAQKYVAPLNAEIIGTAVLSLFDNLRAEDLRPFLDQYHLENVDPHQWYPLQLLFDIEKAMVESKISAIDSTENLVAIGVKLIDSVPFGPNVTTVEEALLAFKEISNRSTRNIPEECGWHFPEVRPGYVLAIDNMPYPDDLLYGYLWATVRRFKPRGAIFSVKRIANKYEVRYPGVAYEIIWG